MRMSIISGDICLYEYVWTNDYMLRSLHIDYLSWILCRFVFLFWYRIRSIEMSLLAGTSFFCALHIWWFKWNKHFFRTENKQPKQ